jgi:hypothetical protein
MYDIKEWNELIDIIEKHQAVMLEPHTLDEIREKLLELADHLDKLNLQEAAEDPIIITVTDLYDLIFTNRR